MFPPFPHRVPSLPSPCALPSLTVWFTPPPASAARSHKFGRGGSGRDDWGTRTYGRDDDDDDDDGGGGGASGYAAWAAAAAGGGTGYGGGECAARTNGYFVVPALKSPRQHWMTTMQNEYTAHSNPQSGFQEFLSTP